MACIHRKLIAGAFLCFGFNVVAEAIGGWPLIDNPLWAPILFRQPHMMVSIPSLIAVLLLIIAVAKK